MAQIIMLSVIAAAFGFLLLRQWLHNRKPTLTGPATVVSHRMGVAKFPTAKFGGETSGYNFLVTFRLSDGDEIELYTTEAEYKQLQEGLTGQLTWHTENFCDFTT